MVSLSFLATLSFLAGLCRSARNVTIENGTGDEETGLLPIYGPTGTLCKWSQWEYAPQNGDSNPDGVSSFVSVNTTILSGTSTVSLLTLLFNGEQNLPVLCSLMVGAYLYSRARNICDFSSNHWNDTA